MYLISEYGEVKTLPRKKGNVFCKGKVLKYDLSSSGYFRVTLCKNNTVKKRSIHRLVYENFVGEITEGLVVHHIDENRKNNHYLNLLACTQRENSHYSAEKSGYKLKEEDIHYIRSNNLSTRQIHEKYGVSMRHALRIIKKERWVI